MSQSLSGVTEKSQPLGTTSARLVAVRLKSANKNIFRALLNLASANLLIRVMGLFNTIVVSARFGQGPEMDAYFVASSLPILFSQLLGSALESSVIPIYARVITKGRREEAYRLFSTLLNLLIIGCLMLTLAMFFLREPLLRISAPGTSINVLNLTIHLAPLVFPVLFFMVLNSFMECLLNAEGKFGWPAYAGLLVPLTTATIVLIMGGQKHSTYGGIFAIGIGSLIGQFLQLCVIILRARRAHLKYLPILDLKHPELKAVFSLAWPALFSSLIGLASPLIDQIFASLQTTGTISVINNAQKINSVPTGVIFAAASRAVLPYLAAQAAIKDMKAFKNTLRLYVWGVALITLGVSLIMGIFAEPIVMLLFKRGAFSDQDVQRTALTLVGFSIGLVPMAVGFILSRAFSALGKSKFLLFVTTFSVGINTVADAIFGHLWQSFGLALATSLYYFIALFVLIFALTRSIGKLNLFTPPPELSQAIWKITHRSYAPRWNSWKEENLYAQGISLQEFGRQVSRWFIILAVFLGGIIGSVTNAAMTVRVAFGGLVVMALIRYQYVLLIGWACINVFIGSPLPFFNGNNLMSGLTIPTLLLMFYLPTKEAFKRMPVLPFFLAFLLWVLISIKLSALPLGAFLTSWTTNLDFVAVGVMVMACITTRKRLLLFIDAMLGAALFITLYGLWGYVTHKMGVMDPNTGYFRIGSIFDTNPPELGLYLSIMTPLLIYRLTTVRGRRLLFGLGVMVLFLAALGLTFARGPLVSFPLGALVITFFLPTRKMRNVAILSFLAVGVLIILATLIWNLPIFNRFFSPDVVTLNGRTQLWKAILDHFDPAQLLGYGHKASDQLLDNLHVGFAGSVIATVAHNIFLETLYDHGIIGLVILILTFVALGASLIRKWFTARIAEQRMLIAMVLWIYINVIIQVNETNDFWSQAIGIYIFMTAALPFAFFWDKEAKKETEIAIDQPDSHNKKVEGELGKSPALHIEQGANK